MQDFLIFRMRGPLASWGASLTGAERTSLPFPTQSAQLGICAGALGLRRDDPTTDVFYQGYGTACRVDAVGTPLRDYHTTQMPSEKALKGQDQRNMTRADILLRATSMKKQLSTILSDRDYYQDAWYEGCLWARNSQAPFTLEQIRDALLEPVFIPFLGRKSCLLSLPMSPRVVQAKNPVEALTMPLGDEDFLAEIHPHLTFDPDSAHYYWEGVFEGLKARRQTMVRDSVSCRSRWQFSSRTIFSRKGLS